MEEEEALEAEEEEEEADSQVEEDEEPHEERLEEVSEEAEGDKVDSPNPSINEMIIKQPHSLIKISVIKDNKFFIISSCPWHRHSLSFFFLVGGWF